jgi:hypothetical protein
MNKQREQFEAWVLTTGVFNDSGLTRSEHSGEYHRAPLQLMYQAWQAAIYTQHSAPTGEVELPVVKTWQERAQNIRPVAITLREQYMDQEIADLRAALRAYGQRAAVPQWISVQDRQPALYTSVLAVISTGEVVMACRGPEFLDWPETDAEYESAEDVGITHWMPLPAAPGSAPSQPQQEAVPAEPSERAKFETWAADHGFGVAMHSAGSYLSGYTQGVWEVWRAAIASMSAEKEPS